MGRTERWMRDGGVELMLSELRLTLHCAYTGDTLNLEEARRHLGVRSMMSAVYSQVVQKKYVCESTYMHTCARAHTHTGREGGNVSKRVQLKQMGQM